MTLRLVVATGEPRQGPRDPSRPRSAPGADVELVARPDDVPEVEETGATLVENARLKAAALRDATGLAAVADDTGLEVDALGGAPGVFSARYAGEDATLRRQRRQAARARSTRCAGRRAPPGSAPSVVLALPDGREIVAEGVVEGVIADEPRGDGGFGYDPVFAPAGGGGRTFAELTPEREARDLAPGPGAAGAGRPSARGWATTVGGTDMPLDPQAQAPDRPHRRHRARSS